MMVPVGLEISIEIFFFLREHVQSFGLPQLISAKAHYVVE
jgi:hypothetical protein